MLYITCHTNLLPESSLQHTDGPSVSLANVSAHLDFPFCLSYGIFCKVFWGPLLRHSHSTALLWDTVDQGVALSPHSHTQPYPCAFPALLQCSSQDVTANSTTHGLRTVHQLLLWLRKPTLHPSHHPLSFQPPSASVGSLRPRTPFHLNI